MPNVNGKKFPYTAAGKKAAKKATASKPVAKKSATPASRVSPQMRGEGTKPKPKKPSSMKPTRKPKASYISGNWSSESGSDGVLVRSPKKGERVYLTKTKKRYPGM